MGRQSELACPGVGVTAAVSSKCVAHLVVKGRFGRTDKIMIIVYIRQFGNSDLSIQLPVPVQITKLER
jgi:hypothetical protein